MKKIIAFALALSFGGCADDDPAGAPGGTPDTALDTADSATSDTAAPDAAVTDTSPDAAFDAADDASDATVDTTPDADPDTTGDTGAPTGEAALLGVAESEQWTLPGLSGPAYVLRTEANVPHVYARTRADLGRVMGFTLARDRYFFMELQRRYSLGTISALLGEAGLETDMTNRLMGLTAVADRLSDHVDGETRAYFEAFVDGVNAYIEAVKQGKLPAPSELDLAGSFLGAADPSDLMQPFTLRDVMAISAALLFETNFDTADVSRQQKLAALATVFEGTDHEELRKDGFFKDIWSQVRPLFPGNASAPSFGTSGLDAVQTATNAGTVEPTMLARLSRTTSRLSRLTHSATGPYGSNAWAVAGAKTESGGALVAGDGHLAMSVPALMYQVAMDTSVLGGGPIHQAGLFLTPFPILGAGTNGDVAWSMVNPVVDITDWYREELQLEDGLPKASRFQGEWRALNPIMEQYVVADVPALGSTGRTETWPRYETFDGRRLLDIEGTELAPGEEPGEQKPLVHFGDRRVVPGDLDGDGVVTAVSFDYGAFDATQWPEALYQMGVSKDVLEFREATRGVVGGGLFMAAGDSLGNVIFSSYQAIPCRGYLPRDAEGFSPGADPNFLLDGTQYGGFTLPTTAKGHADEAAGEADPYSCVIPFEAMPQSLNPDAGFVVTANNQPAPIDDDGNHTNDAWYVGGPWQSPRADTIRRRLEGVVAAGDASVADMASVQADRASRLGESFTPPLLAAIEKAREIATIGDPGTPHEERIAAIYAANEARFDAVATRLAAWSFDAPSGVETFYEAPTEQERADAVATMLFNAWLPRFVDGVWGDEPANSLFPYRADNTRLAAILAFLDARGPENPKDIASWSVESEESVFFDRVGTPEVEQADELMLTALADALDFLASPPTTPGEGGFGTADMAGYLWGLRHQVQFVPLLAQVGDDPTLKLLVDLFAITTTTLPLADSLPAGDPRKGLVHFPRGGDNFAVDAAAQGLAGDQFRYTHGPVMRMVVQLGAKVEGQNIIPGGQSGLIDSPHFADQAKLWLGNDAIPLRFHLDDVTSGATARETFLPE